MTTQSIEHAAILRPADAQELCAAVTDAADKGDRLRIEGGGSKNAIGAPVGDCTTLSMRAFSGIVDYDPPELVLTAKAATPMAEIERALAEKRQMLAFEPFDLGPILGEQAGQSTIGGVIGAGLSGSQRLTHGAVRDHLLGFTAVSGRGELFTAGGKVVKNVTGYDLSKLMCGSWGRLAALTEVTVKVLPRPAVTVTMVARGLDPRSAWAAFAGLLGSHIEIAAAAYAPAGLLDEKSLAAIRLQGFPPSVDARCAMAGAMPDIGGFETVREGEGAAFWQAMRDLSPLSGDAPLWRIVLPAREAPAFTAALPEGAGRWMMDWAGGLIWLTGEVEPDRLRALAARHAGHAMLLRAPASVRAETSTLHPQPAAIAALEDRVRRAFDTKSVFETGRF